MATFVAGGRKAFIYYWDSDTYVQVQDPTFPIEGSAWGAATAVTGTGQIVVTGDSMGKASLSNPIFQTWLFDFIFEN